MTRWLWTLAIAVPVTLVGVLPTSANADDDNGHHYRRDHRRYDHQGYYQPYYQPHGHGFAEPYYVQPHLEYDDGYYGGAYYRHHHFRHGHSFGVYTPFGSVYLHD